MSILRIKNQETGEWESIPAIVGPQGPQGPQGAHGPAGANGKTPVKGTDYFTEADKAEMVSAVIAALPDASEVGY